MYKYFFKKNYTDMKKIHYICKKIRLLIKCIIKI